MNSSTRISPGVAGLRFVINMACLNRSCDRSDIRFSPPPAAVRSENEPPSLVDSDRMQAAEMALQLLEMVAGRRSQVAVRVHIVDHLDFTNKDLIFRPGLLDELTDLPVT